MENYGVLNDFLTLVDMSRDLVERIGDCPNVEISVNSNSILWNTLEKRMDGVYRREKSQETFELSLRMAGKWETEVWLSCAKKCTG